ALRRLRGRRGAALGRALLRPGQRRLPVDQRPRARAPARMSARERLALGALLLLALVAAGLATRIVRRQPGLAADLGAAALHHTTPEMAARLASLSDPVFLTLYLIDAARMPSELRGLERDLVALCETLEHESGGRIAYQIVDPTG